MRHGRARRLLPSVLDGNLPPRQEAAVRAHVDRCRRCRRGLAELRAAEALLARLPATLVPREASPQAEARLLGLARWATEPPLSWQDRGLSALGAFAALLLFVGLVEFGSVPPAAEPTGEAVTIAAVLPDTRLFPTGVR